MARLDTSLWQHMLDYLRQQHSAICRHWFEELEPAAFDGGLLQIYTEDQVRQKYLQSRCVDQFREAAQSVTGKLVAVRFTSDATIFNRRDNTADYRSNTIASGSTAPLPRQDASRPRDITANLTAHVPSNHAVNPAQPAPALPSISEFDGDQMVLSPDYSFENFVSGPNNELAYAAAVAVANQPGTAYNPMFIHGGVGLGKTHLLQSICQKILRDNPTTRILFVSCDTFLNQFIECVQNGQMNEFRHRYRHVDMLVIDDIHFLSDRDRTQEEFFHTFNALRQSNRQIVLSSDAAPSEIPNLEERLVSRFQSGLVAQVTKPSYETRVAIIHNKAKLRGIAMPDEVVQFIASKNDTNARELEGSVTTIQAFAALQNRAIDIKLAREALGEPEIEPQNNQIKLQNIFDVVTGYYNVRLADLQSRRRHKSVTEPRQICMWLVRKMTRFSLEEIGGYFGGRDHTTVMHSVKTVEDRMMADPVFQRTIEQLESKISGGS